MAKKTLGKMIAEAREKAGLSQAELAKALAVSQGTVSRLESDLPVSSPVMRNAITFLRKHISSQIPARLILQRDDLAKREVKAGQTKRLWEYAVFRYSSVMTSGDVLVITLTLADFTGRLLTILRILVFVKFCNILLLAAFIAFFHNNLYRISRGIMTYYSIICVTIASFFY